MVFTFALNVHSHVCHTATLKATESNTHTERKRKYEFNARTLTSKSYIIQTKLCVTHEPVMVLTNFRYLDESVAFTVSTNNYKAAEAAAADIRWKKYYKILLQC